MLVLVLNMTRSGSVLWIGKPWVLPSVLFRSIFIVVVVVVVALLEIMFAIANETIADLLSSVTDLSGMPIISTWTLMVWTGLVLVLVWFFSILRLVLLRVSQTYVLHDDSLEIRSGILTSRAFVVSPSGFSELEVFRSVVGRIVECGDIVVETQSEADSVVRLVRVRNPLRVADQIRGVMARPVVRVEGSEPRVEKK
jgi:uncharacterized membrane protein YdbT with pleckstrin-like domain